MSSSERKPPFRMPLLRAFAVAAGLVGMLLVSACTVRPLYGDVSASISPDGGSRLSSIAVKPVSTREAQEVRNHLIFAFNGGAGEPATPHYILDLFVQSTVRAVASIQTAEENEPTAGIVLMNSRYVLTDAQSGQVVATGTRSVTASLDRPEQVYASQRAARDAENRAARELAEYLRLAVAQDLERVAAR